MPLTCVLSFVGCAAIGVSVLGGVGLWRAVLWCGVVCCVVYGVLFVVLAVCKGQRVLVNFDFDVFMF